MYAEIQTAINLLSSYLFTKLPRRKVNLFGEQLGNYLILKFQSHWYPSEPQKGSAFRCIRISVMGLTDALVGAAAESVGIDLDDLLQYLPAELTVWVDPGEVSYKVGDIGPSTLLYSSNPEAQQPLLGTDSTSLPSLYFPTRPTTLRLSSSPTPFGTPNPLIASEMSLPTAFELSSPHDPKFTVGTFAMTRFGTTKMKSASGVAEASTPTSAWDQTRNDHKPVTGRHSLGSSSYGSLSPSSEFASWANATSLGLGLGHGGFLSIDTKGGSAGGSSHSSLSPASTNYGSATPPPVKPNLSFSTDDMTVASNINIW